MTKSDRETMKILEAFDATGVAHSATPLCNADPKTVRRYAQARDLGWPVGEPVPRSKLIDPFLDKVEEWVDRSEGKVRAAMGFGGTGGPRGGGGGPGTAGPTIRASQNLGCGCNGTGARARRCRATLAGCGAKPQRKRRAACPMRKPVPRQNSHTTSDLVSSLLVRLLSGTREFTLARPTGHARIAPTLQVRSRSSPRIVSLQGCSRRATLDRRPAGGQGRVDRTRYRRRSRHRSSTPWRTPPARSTSSRSIRNHR